MVVIGKGDKRKTVTSAAFDNYYKNSGWKVVKGVNSPSTTKKEEKKQQEEVPEETSDEWDGFVDDDNSEKDISEMSREELEAKAQELGIDTMGLGTTKQLRSAIRKQLAD